MSNGNEFFKYARSLQKVRTSDTPVSYTHLTLPTTSRRQRQMCIRDSDPVCEELKNPKSKIAGVILASDVSEKTQKEMRFFCDKYSALLSQCDCTMDEIKSVLGKRTGVLAVLDEGLYASLTGEHKGK